MMGADSGAGLGAGPEWRWDVALSFADAQRGYVGQVAEALKARGVRCFYDIDEQIELWGKHLAEELPTIYSEQAATVVVFMSAEYVARDWTRHERRAALARAVQERREYVLPARFDDTPIPGLLSDMVTIDLRGRSPLQFADMIVDKLATLTIAGPIPLLAKGDPAKDAKAERPTGGVRVGEADSRRLGVHAAISVPGVPEDIQPEYVPRDVDDAESGLRAKVEAAAQRGGFVLLVGGSSVGKTRCAVEALKALLPDWWLVHPAGPDQVAMLAQAPSAQTVVWLDELQRYLDGEPGLSGGVVRALLNGPYPAVIIGTLWPDQYTSYTAVPAPGGADPHGRKREVLDLAGVIRIDGTFSPAEQGRARAAAAHDRRLKIALQSAEYGLTQTLAAAPQLVARWQDAKTVNPYAWAVLTAALDVARLGARAPLSTELLRAAAPGYCSSQQQAEASDDWFEQALAYATGKLHGAAAALAPAGAGMGRVVGYTVAEYLIQHASRERRYVRIPASTWDSIISHIGDAADTARLADSAGSRLLYRYAIPLYRRATDAGDGHAARQLVDLLAVRGDVDGAVHILQAKADAGDGDAAWRLADLLVGRGDLDGLRTRADAGDGHAARRLVDLLAERGDVDGAAQILRARADAGDGDAAWRLADLLVGRGDLDGLRTRADAGDGHAARRLAGLLAERGDLDGLRTRADAGDGDAAFQLAGLLAGRGDLDGLRARADAGDGDAAFQLAGLLAGRGNVDGATQILRARADAGDEYAARRLADLLAGRGDVDGATQILRARADAGDQLAALRLAGLLAERGDLDGLRARADAGDADASVQMDRLLADRRDLGGLRARAEVGDEYAELRLANLLAERGDVDAATQILRSKADDGNGDAALRLAGLLAGRNDLDGLQARAEAGDLYAARRLAGLLAGHGDIDGLRARAEAGDGYAARRLAGLLAGRGDIDGAAQILHTWADVGDQLAALRLADLLARHGHLDGLRARAEAGDGYAARWLAGLLAGRGDIDGAAQILSARADSGDSDAALRLADLLAGHGHLDGLRARVDAGDEYAASRLAALLIKQGRGEEAERLRRFGLNPDGSIASA